MWCSQCQQDVPGIASYGEQPQVACARCGANIREEAKVDVADQAGDEKGNPSPNDEEERKGKSPLGGATWRIDPLPVDMNAWMLDEQLQQAERLIQSVKGAPQYTHPENMRHHPEAMHGEPGTARRHPESELVRAALPPWQMTSSQPLLHNFYPEGAHPNGYSPNGSKPPGAPSQNKQNQVGSVAAWLFLAIGLMAFVCGGVLLGWSVFGNRPDLWNLGLPIALGGQAGLLIGFVFQLEAIWRNSRHNTEMLNAYNQQLQELHNPAPLIHAHQENGAPHFYPSRAPGPGPHAQAADYGSPHWLHANQIANQ